MMPIPNMIRVGVFYDGNFFNTVSNYYKFIHRRKERLSIGGLHRFIASEIAREEKADASRCQIVDAHYFRGRLNARAAEEQGTLKGDRILDDILMREGVVTHFTALGRFGEKGIDVWFALEALELTILKQFDVVVLVAGDGDFVPLVRKLNSRGTRVMVLGWDFEWTQGDASRTTRTSQALLDAANYKIIVSKTIDDRTRQNDPLIGGLFVSSKDLASDESESEDAGARTRESVIPATSGVRHLGMIVNLKELQGYGFITPRDDGDNVFFHYSNVRPGTSPTIGDVVEFSLGANSRGPCAIDVAVIDAEES